MVISAVSAVAVAALVLTVPMIVPVAAVLAIAPVPVIVPVAAVVVVAAVALVAAILAVLTTVPVVATLAVPALLVPTGDLVAVPAPLIIPRTFHRPPITVQARPIHPLALAPPTRIRRLLIDGSTIALVNTLVVPALPRLMGHVTIPLLRLRPLCGLPDGRS